MKIRCHLNYYNLTKHFDIINNALPHANLKKEELVKFYERINYFKKLLPKCKLDINKIIGLTENDIDRLKRAGLSSDILDRFENKSVLFDNIIELLKRDPKKPLDLDLSNLNNNPSEKASMRSSKARS